MTPSIPTVKAPKDGVPPPIQFETGRLEFLDKNQILIFNVFPQQKAAKHLNVSESTLKRRLKRWRIVWPKKSLRDKTLSAIKKFNHRLHSLIDKIEEQERELHLMRQSSHGDVTDNPPRRGQGEVLLSSLSPHFRTILPDIPTSAPRSCPVSTFSSHHQQHFIFPSSPHVQQQSTTPFSSTRSPASLYPQSPVNFLPPHFDPFPGGLKGPSSHSHNHSAPHVSSSRTSKQKVYLKCHDSLLRAKFSLLSFLKQRDSNFSPSFAQQTDRDQATTTSGNCAAAPDTISASPTSKFLGDLALLTSHIPDPLKDRPQVLMDREGNIIACNKNFVKLTGMSYDKFCQGVNINRFLVPSEEQTTQHQKIEQVIQRIVNVSTLLTLQFVVSFYVHGKGIICSEAFIEKCDQNFWAFLFVEGDTSPEPEVLVVNETVLFPKKSVTTNTTSDSGSAPISCRLSHLKNLREHSENQSHLIDGLMQLVRCICGEI